MKRVLIAKILLGHKNFHFSCRVRQIMLVTKNFCMLGIFPEFFLLVNVPGLVDCSGEHLIRSTPEYP